LPATAKVVMAAVYFSSPQMPLSTSFLPQPWVTLASSVNVSVNL